MKKHFLDNWFFFLLIGLLAVCGGIYLIFYEKPDLIYFFSNNRNSFLNIFFTYFTKMGEEIAYLVIGLLLLFKKIRYGLMIGLCGFFVMGLSFGLKVFFAIDRPIAFFRKNNLLEQVNLVPEIDLHSAATSFPSGHSMSAFAVYGLLILMLPSRKRYVVPLLLIALGVAVSRVYLMQHFYEDVYAGSMIGVGVAFLLYALNDKLNLPEDHLLERPVSDLFKRKETVDAG